MFSKLIEVWKYYRRGPGCRLPNQIESDDGTGDVGVF